MKTLAVVLAQKDWVVKLKCFVFNDETPFSNAIRDHEHPYIGHWVLNFKAIRQHDDASTSRARYIVLRPRKRRLCANSSTGTAAASGSFASLKSNASPGRTCWKRIKSTIRLCYAAVRSRISAVFSWQGRPFFDDMIWPSFAKGLAHGLRIGSIGRLAIQRLLQQ